MKKYFLGFIILISFSILTAQDNAQDKKYFAGLGLSLNYQKNYIPLEAYNPFLASSSVYASFSRDNVIIFRGLLNLQGGRQLNDYSAYGVLISYGWEKYTYDAISLNSSSSFSQYDESSRNYGIGIFARYTINPENLLQAFIQPAFLYQKDSRSLVQDGVSSSGISVHKFEGSARIGFLYQLNEEFRLNLSMGSFYILAGRWKNDFGSHDNFFTVGTQFNFSSLQIGAEYMF